MTERVELVVFDLGGVLVQAGSSWTEAALQLGHALDQAWLLAFEQRLRDVPRMATGRISSDLYFERFAEVSGGIVSPAEARAISHASLGGEYPRIAEVFDRLEAAGITTAALSNTSDDHWLRLFPQPGASTEFPSLSRIRYRLASHLLGIEKPDPRAYQAIEQETGYVGGSILFFDDREENLVPARQMNWQGQFIDHLGDPVEQMLSELRSRGI